MDKPDDPRKRLRKAREEVKKRQAAKRETFTPFRTMFKLCHPRPSTPRQLECVSCGLELEWRIYTVAPAKFDSECPECGVKARDYWNGRPSKELTDASEEG